MALTESKRTKAGADSKTFHGSNSVPIPAVVVVDEDGNGSVDLSSYGISDIDADTSPNYYGFERADGAWFILKETLSPGADTYRYIKGASDFATNWTGRVALSYDTFVNTF